MTRRRMTLLTFAVVMAAVVAGSVADNLVEQRRTAFSVEVLATQTVARISPGQPVCQGPIAVPWAFSGVVVWVTPGGVRPAPIVAYIRRAGDLAVALTAPLQLPAGAKPNATTTARVNFGRTVAPGPPVELCLRGAPGPSHAPLSLLGQAPSSVSGSLTPASTGGPHAAALLFLAPHARSVLALLPTMLDRAALFRPTWMGAWTYWVLLAGLGAAVVLLGVSLTAAARADAETDSA